MKLVTKAMCILKNSPFVPEWRAGDQIAFLTERNGYLPTDFIDIQMPQFSYSAISAIKVAAYVNLEFETEFLLEAVRSITAPLNSIGGNVVNMFETSISDINVDVNIPTQIDIDVESDGTIDTDISFESLETHPENIYSLAELFAGQFMRMISFMDERR